MKKSIATLIVLLLMTFSLISTSYGMKNEQSSNVIQLTLNSESQDSFLKTNMLTLVQTAVGGGFIHNEKGECVGYWYTVGNDLYIVFE